MIFNLKNKQALEHFRQEGKKLIELETVVELKVVRKTRTSTQNRALHLFFRMVSDALNDAGITHITTLRGANDWEIESRWTSELVKESIWKPIQLAMFGTDSTTKLKTNEIDKIFETINLHFGEMGIDVHFPNQFDYFLKFYSDGRNKFL
jgi:hypothetical protein